MATTEIKPKRVSVGKPNTYPFYSPRIWHGMRLGDWMKLLARGGFRISPLRIPMFCTVTGFAPINSMMSWIESLCYGRAVRQSKLQHPPLFIVGHWRSGTTLLHELLVLDDRFCFPTTYQCLAPSHFLLSEPLFTRLFWILLPATRPMDNMPTGWKHPQEDEFALGNLGLPSPYDRMAFPNDPAPYLNYLDMEGLSPRELEIWKQTLDGFVRKVAYRTGKRVVLKSPTHTGRLKTLTDLYPGAQFVHLVRNPEALFPSTMRLWQSLDEVQGLQIPHGRALEEYVFTALQKMYEGFEKQRAELPSEAVFDLHYEDLVRDPLGRLREIYEHHNLGDFEYVRPKVEEYLAREKNYQPNRHQLDDELREEIHRRWAPYCERYGYNDSPSAQPPQPMEAQP